MKVQACPDHAFVTRSPRYFVTRVVIICPRIENEFARIVVFRITDRDDFVNLCNCLCHDSSISSQENHIFDSQPTRHHSPRSLPRRRRRRCTQWALPNTISKPSSAPPIAPAQQKPSVTKALVVLVESPT